MNNKPDWKDAPEWAQWLSMDSDGEWYWHDRKPKKIDNIWDSHDVQYKVKRAEVKVIVNWEETLEKRPK